MTNATTQTLAEVIQPEQDGPVHDGAVTPESDSEDNGCVTRESDNSAGESAADAGTVGSATETDPTGEEVGQPEPDALAHDDVATPEVDGNVGESAEDAVTTESATETEDAPGEVLTREVGADRKGRSKKAARRISISLPALVVIIVVVAFVAAAAVMTWLYLGERNKVNVQQQQAANDRHAEQIALDYAVDAATMNFQNMNDWKNKLVKGTTPKLTEKLTKAATQMEQILVPLEWNSTAQPLVAKVRSNAGGIYVVDAFVSVSTKTTQTPDPLPSTATYSISIDSHDNWLISDVGGIGAVAGPK